jgi:hypothetical protein
MVVQVEETLVNKLELLIKLNLMEKIKTQATTTTEGFTRDIFNDMCKRQKRRCLKKRRMHPKSVSFSFRLLFLDLGKFIVESLDLAAERPVVLQSFADDRAKHFGGA